MAGTDEDANAKKIKCNYPYLNCIGTFKTEKEMKRHKKEDPEHFYCKRCDVDCEDWNDFKAHKVAAMAPWLEGQKKGNKDESPMHIVCEFCGMDFESFGGRKSHREHTHPADQHIVCDKCNTRFTRAGNYLAHFEENRCSVSRRQFLDRVQHEHVRGQILQIQDNLERAKESNALIEDCTRDTEEGGINLIDQDDENQQSGVSPLDPERNMIEMNQQPQYRHKKKEEYPSLPKSDISQLTASTSKLSISSPPAASFFEPALSASDYASQITSRRDGTKVYSEATSSPRLPRNSAYLSDGDDTTSVASTTVAASSNVSGAWMNGNTSQMLFKEAKPTPPPTDYGQVLQRREEEAQAHPNNDIRRARFWDPSWDHFDISVFDYYDEEEGWGYKCPFPDCEESFYVVGIDLEEHLKLAHTKTKFNCPLCLKRFKSPAALISHSESPGCKVKKSSKYGALLNELSGGLLNVESMKEQKIAKDTEGGSKGIMTHKFTAQPPKDDIRW